VKLLDVSASEGHSLLRAKMASTFVPEGMRDDVRARSVSGNKSDREMDSDVEGGYEKGDKMNHAAAFPTQGPAVRDEMTRIPLCTATAPHPCTHGTCSRRNTIAQPSCVWQCGSIGVLGLG
jgi:hypothetical protein